MNISELITLLEKEKREHGDLPVYLDHALQERKLRYVEYTECGDKYEEEPGILLID